EVLITLALVMVIYAIAIRLHLSGPIAVVIAGLFIGNHGAKFAMSENTRNHVFQFWELIDEILNSVLFLLIGLEVIVLGSSLLGSPVYLAAIPVALAARNISVAIPISLLSIRERFERGTISLLTWGGLRGGISVALALSLPDVPEKPAILAATYAVVVFSIIVQGLTMKRLVRRFGF
ncbi:MAG TPA: sodium:proton antiporter, partial [Rhizobiales bacterium]|nr:sodium:proton antiporter [Hyphomicrobiales bacterium]